MNEKLKELNNLEREIHSLDDFIRLLKKGNSLSEYHKDGTKNKFSELSIGAYIYTGSDNPKNNKTLNGDVLNRISAILIPLLEAELRQRKDRFNFVSKENYY